MLHPRVSRNKVQELFIYNKNHTEKKVILIIMSSFWVYHGCKEAFFYSELKKQHSVTKKCSDLSLFE